MSRTLLRVVALGALLATATLAAHTANAEDDEESWSFRDLSPAATLRFDAEYGLNTRDGHGQKAHETVFGEFSITPTSNLTVLTSLRIQAEILDNLDPGPFSATSYARGTKPATPGDVTEIDLREAYLQWQQGPLQLRLGKQQIVWGEADGLKVLDIVEPQDFREFILPEFSESRIPLWAFRMDLELGERGVPGTGWLGDGAALQLLFVPDPSVHNIADVTDLGQNPDAPYAPTSPLIVPEPPDPLFASFVEFGAVQPRPEWDPSNFDVGGRLSLPIGRVDTALYYLWHIDDFPVVAYGPASLVLQGTNLIIDVPVLLENRRYHMIGASSSSAVGDFVVRGEFTYSFKRAISQNYVIPPAVVGDMNDQVGKSDDIAWVLGLDWFGLSDSLFSVQLFQNVLVQARDSMLRRKYETAMTFHAQRSFLQERLSIDVTYLLGLNDADGLVRPRIEYEWNDYFSFWIGADLFHGTKRGLFGQYGSNDRVIFGFSLGWTSG